MGHTHLTPEDYHKVRVLAERGLTAKQIAAALDISLSSAQSRLTRMTMDGTIPGAAERKRLARGNRVNITELRERYDKRLGQLPKLVELLNSDQFEWLYANTPEGSTIIEFIAALIRDAYEEERDAGVGQG